MQLYTHSLREILHFLLHHIPQKAIVPNCCSDYTSSHRSSKNCIFPNLAILNVSVCDKLKAQVVFYEMRKFSYFLSWINYLKSLLDQLENALSQSWKEHCSSGLMKGWMFGDTLFSQDTSAANIQLFYRIWCIAVDWAPKQFIKQFKWAQL